MSLYSILLFVHVSGAICLFIGLSIWLFSIMAISRASRVEQVRELIELMVMVRLVVPAVICAGRSNAAPLDFCSKMHLPPSWHWLSAVSSRVNGSSIPSLPSLRLLKVRITEIALQ